jgi:ADP-heptose:LPS heptosyltransferase
VDRILVISLSGIGDTLMATPLFHELRRQYPRARIEALVLWKGARQILLGNPHVDEVHQHDFLGGSRTRSIAFCLRLRKRRYDLSINTHTQGRRGYRLIARLIGARERLSHEYENQGWPDRLLITRSCPQDYGLHAMENNLRLLERIGLRPTDPDPRYEVFLEPSERDWAARWCAENTGGEGRMLGIHVGSGGTKNLALRRWPLENWAGLLRALPSVLPGIRPVLFGGPEEAALHAELRRSGVAFQEAKTSTLREAMALVARCAGFISVDTVFMHVAAAMDVPRQWVIETPTLNPPVHPRRRDWIRIPNPGVGGRPLDFYRYDGRDIAGSPDELRRIMRSVTVDNVLESLRLGF